MTSSVLLGLSDIEIPQDTSTTWDTNKIGGIPDWMGESMPVTQVCAKCGMTLSLVVQIYCPIAVYHRTLYVFACLQKACWENSQCWKVYRTQMLDPDLISTDQPDPCTSLKKHAMTMDSADSWGNNADDWGLDDSIATNELLDLVTNKLKSVDTDSSINIFETKEITSESNPDMYAINDNARGIQTLELNSVTGTTEDPHSDDCTPIDPTLDPPGHCAPDDPTLGPLGHCTPDDPTLDPPGHCTPNDPTLDPPGHCTPDDPTLDPPGHCTPEDCTLDPRDSALYSMLVGEMTPGEDANCTTFSTNSTPDSRSSGHVLIGRYISVVAESDFQPHSRLEHEEVLLREYQKSTGVNVDDLLKSYEHAQGGEKYEKATARHGNRAFHKTMKRLALCPDQVLRYDYKGEELYLDTVIRSTRPRCPSCGGLRVFELQLLPTLVNFLRLDRENDPALEFGTVHVYTCENNCWEESSLYREEDITIYPDPDLVQ